MKRVLFLTTLLVVASSAVGRAEAADIPIFEIDQICAKAAADALPLTNRCIEAAQTSCDNLKTKTWKSSTDDDQTPCIAKAKDRSDAVVYQTLDSYVTAAAAERKVREDALVLRHFKP